jgi:hypothetical protein
VDGQHGLKLPLRIALSGDINLPDYYTDLGNKICDEPGNVNKLWACVRSEEFVSTAREEITRYPSKYDICYV